MVTHEYEHLPTLVIMNVGPKAIMSTSEHQHNNSQVTEMQYYGQRIGSHYVDRWEMLCANL